MARLQRHARACGFSAWGQVPMERLVPRPEIRTICETNVCRNYGSTWACPPAVGTLEACGEKLRSYRQAMLFSKVYALEDSFDFEGMQAGHRDFKGLCDRLYDEIHGETPEHLLLSNEGCLRCVKCAYPDGPCRFPDMLFPSLEGFGLIVSDLADAAGMRYSGGPDTVTYFGMLLV